MNELLTAIRLYDRNRNALLAALSEAGGNPIVVLRQEHWVTVMEILACNNIAVSATYLDPKAPQPEKGT